MNPSATTLTDDERMQLASLPHQIGSAMAMAGASGVFGTGKELFASAQAILAGAKDHPGSTLIRSIVPDLQAADRQAQLDAAGRLRDWGRSRLKRDGIDSPAKFTEMTLQDCRQAAALLARLDPGEASQYRQWALSVAEKVAQSSTEGGFLGFGGERLSANEKQLLEQIRTALG